MVIQVKRIMSQIEKEKTMKKIVFRTGRHGNPVYPHSVSGMASRAEILGYTRTEDVDVDKLSPLARFLADNLELIWPGNIFSTKKVNLFSDKPDSFHVKEQFRHRPQYAENLIYAYGLENKFSPLNFMPSFDYLVGNETPEDYLERHARIIQNFAHVSYVEISGSRFYISEKLAA